MYNCKYCGKEFKDKGNLRRHEKYAHEVSISKEPCPFCNELFQKAGLHTHIKHCENNPDKVLTTKAILKEKAYKRTLPGNCKFCGKDCHNQNSLNNHERLCKSNPNRQTTLMMSSEWQNEMRSRIDRTLVWNKGLTADTDSRVKTGAEKLSNYYKEHSGTFTGKHHSENTRNFLRDIAVENDFYKHFGRTKTFNYTGVHFQSSYEYVLAVDLDKNNIKWEQPKRLSYIDLDGLKHYYIADLYLPDYNIYLDPKNDYLIENVNPYFGYKDVDKIKWVMEQNNVKILILDKEHLTWEKIKHLVEQHGG